MLNIFLYIPFFILAIIGYWLMIKNGPTFDGVSIDAAQFFFNNFNKLFKTSFDPHERSLIRFIINESPIYSLPIMLLMWLYPIPIEQGMISLMLSILIMCLFIGCKAKLENIFNELDDAVFNYDSGKIIEWIKKYQKFPFFLKIAKKEFYDTYFTEVYQSITLYKDLNLNLSSKSTTNKKNKI